MIKNLEKDLQKRFFGNKTIKRVFYKGTQIWPIGITETYVTPNEVSLTAEGGYKENVAEVIAVADWQFE